MSANGNKKVLVLGAGFVTRPLVRYLTDNKVHITVADKFVEKAEAVVKGRSNAVAKDLNINDQGELEKAIASHDLTISLLPAYRHVEVAKLCLKRSKHFFSTSYVKPEIRKMEKDVKKKGLLFMNELGADPGLDHMSAVKIFDDVRQRGGEIKSFMSYCGGLPAPEANDNPWGYKFSWSPASVLIASKNRFKFLKDGKIEEGPGGQLFDNCQRLKIEGLGEFEAYPNRNSTQYIDLYGLKNAHTVARWTLRNKGWCGVMKHIPKTGLLNTNRKAGFVGMTRKEFLAACMNEDSPENIRQKLIKKLKIDGQHDLIKWFDWLGVFSDEEIVRKNKSSLKVFAGIMLDKMAYKESERDMLVLFHDVTAQFNEKKERTTSTLIDYGIPKGNSAMSRTVGLPCAIGVKLFLDGKYKLSGVHIPVDRAVYIPILEELEAQGISFTERSIKVKP